MVTLVSAEAANLPAAPVPEARAVVLSSTEPIVISPPKSAIELSDAAATESALADPTVVRAPVASAPVVTTPLPHE
jgi:hypothetical protein